MEPIPVSRPLLFGLVAVGAVLAVATAPPTSSFAAGFAAGAGAVFVISFMKGRPSGGPAGTGSEP
ncbi:MAG TPA: hypothetical protein VGH97_16680 [Thermoanaerobaculia bacterium]